MKVRVGFVSNSSSSSFVIGFRGNSDELEKKLLEVFDPKSKGPFCNLASDVVSVLARGKSITEQEYRKQECIDDDEEICDKDLFDKFGQIFRAKVHSDSGEALDAYLYEEGEDFEHEEDELVIRFRG